MPDYVVHTIFGEGLLSVPGVREAIGDQRALTAWRWGLQGPDPLFFRRATDPAGGAMHRGAPEGMFDAMLRHMAGLPERDRHIAEAWLLGFLAHYFLDRTVHPYVDARMEEMSRRMPDATGNARHYQIETDMDADLWVWVRRRPLSGFDPSRGMALGPREKEVIAGMLAAGAAAKEVVLPIQSAIKALDSAAIAQRFIFRGGAVVRTAARGLERMLGKNRQLTSHIKGKRPRWDSLNLGRAPWTDPRDGTVRTQSVPDLMERAARDALPALERLSRLAEGEERGGPDLGGQDFSGRK